MYADQRAHDVARMTAAECSEYGARMAAVDADVAVAAGYASARRMYGDSYADYLISHDRELIAKGHSVTPWPQSLAGNDGD